MTAHRLAASAALLAALSGCSLLGSLARSAYEPPTLEYQSWSARALDAEGVTIALRYLVTNPNERGLRLSRAGYVLELEGKHAATGELPLGLEVPARGTAAVDLPVRVRWRDVPDLVRLVATRRDVGFKVSGSAAVATGFGDVTLPFSREGRVEVPRPPAFAIRGARVRQLSLSGIDLDLELELENTNSFPLPIGALAYGLRLGDGTVMEGEAAPLAAVPPGGRATVRIPVRLSLQGAGAAIQRLLGGEPVPLEVRGSAGFGDLSFPFSAETEARAPERQARH